MTAPLVAALNDCKALPVNPAKAIGGKVRKVRPLLWTPPRTERWRLTGPRPAPVMVWTREQCETFLDAISGHRMYALYHLAACWGLRRGELAGLQWPDVDLAGRRIAIRGDVKSEDSNRTIPIDAGTAEVLETWRNRQMFEALEAGGAWTDTGHVFTREDGQPLRRGWISERFGTLAARAGLPPVRFHDLRHGSASLPVFFRPGQGGVGDHGPRHRRVHRRCLRDRGRRAAGRRGQPDFRVHARLWQQCASRGRQMSPETRPATLPQRQSDW